MSSNKLDEGGAMGTDQGKSPTSKKTVQLADLSCPFTWGMECIMQNRNKLLDSNKNRLERVVDMQDDFPEFLFIYYLMLACENVMSDELLNAVNCATRGGEILAEIKKKGSLKNVENVLQHISVATTCHVLQKLQTRTTELHELLNGICDVEDMNETEMAMLYGCQCLGWLLYYATDNSKAIDCAEKAIEYDADNGKWYFLLGKIYRRRRRRQKSMHQRPSPEEISALNKAFKLSKNAMFGLSLAQLYRESSKYDMANKVCREIYDLEPTCCKIRLQLALSFIHAKQNKLAKDCLDYVAKDMPNSAMYEYYMAIYQEKCNHDIKAALFHYGRATEKENFMAEWKYIESRKQVEPDWDPFPYMKDLLTKYEKDSDDVTQEINIKLGSYYLFEKRDILSACIILTKAIEISPNSKLLKQHDVLFRGFRVNVYHVLEKEVRFTLANATQIDDEDMITILKDTLQLCGQHCKDLPTTSASSSARALNSESRNRVRTHDYCPPFGRVTDADRRRMSASYLLSLIDPLRQRNNINQIKSNGIRSIKVPVLDTAGGRRTQTIKSSKLIGDSKDSAISSASPLAKIPSSKSSRRCRNNTRDISPRGKISAGENPSSSSQTIPRKTESSKLLDKDCKDLIQTQSSRSSRRCKNNLQDISSRAKINAGEKPSSSTGTIPKHNPRGNSCDTQGPRPFGSNRERDDKPKGSDGWGTRDKRNGNRSSSSFRDGKDSESKHRMRSKSIQHNIMFPNQRHKNDGSGDSAACSLVKTLRNTNL